MSSPLSLIIALTLIQTTVTHNWFCRKKILSVLRIFLGSLELTKFLRIYEMKNNEYHELDLFKIKKM